MNAFFYSALKRSPDCCYITWIFHQQRHRREHCKSSEPSPNIAGSSALRIRSEGALIYLE